MDKRFSTGSPPERGREEEEGGGWREKGKKKKSWQSHSASKVDTCLCADVCLCVRQAAVRPNKRRAASMEAFHGPGFQLLSRLKDYFLLSIFI